MAAPPYGDTYVTVILNVTPIRDHSDSSRLLDMVAGYSTQVFETWLASQPTPGATVLSSSLWGGFTGFKSPNAEELPRARVVMDPFHVVHLAKNALDDSPQRNGQELHARLGRAMDLLYEARGWRVPEPTCQVPGCMKGFLGRFLSRYCVVFFCLLRCDSA